MRILIVGGYGVFGGRIVRLLADEPRLTLIVAGRSAARAHVFCAGLAAQATLDAICLDRDGELTTQLRAIAPDLIVDASGPFQAYGRDPYRLVRAALEVGADYLDLADCSDFVAGIGTFDVEARAAQRFVLSGVSSFPVLTAAVVRHLGRGLQQVEAITGGIAPSPYAGVGRNVIEAIASYAGKPLELTRGGRRSTGHGLTETMRYTIAPPGRLPLDNTLFSLVDVPDLKVLPQHWPGLGSIWMGAGPVPEVLHRGLVTLAWLVRLRVLPSLSFLAPLFHWAINRLRWGEHRGGMFVQVEGIAPGGAAVTRSWHMIAEGDDGPLIPSMAVEAIVRKCLDGERPGAGARAATGDLELSDYERLFGRRRIVCGVREERAGELPEPLYRRILGTAWHDLPQPIRDVHDLRGSLTVEGVAQVERGRNLIAHLIAGVFGFPSAGRDVAVAVRFEERGGKEIWTRTFGRHTFSSEQSQGCGRSTHLVVERFGPFRFALALVPLDGRLSIAVRRWSVLGIPLPLALAPSSEGCEYVRDGRFNFDVAIRLPLIGLIVHYRGWLVPRA